MFGFSFSQAASSSFLLFWCLFPVAKVCSVGFVGFLVEWTVACVLVDEAGSFLSGGRTTSGGVVWGVCDLIMAASLLMGGVVFLFC